MDHPIIAKDARESMEVRGTSFTIDLGLPSTEVKEVLRDIQQRYLNIRADLYGQIKLVQEGGQEVIRAVASDELNGWQIYFEISAGNVDHSAHAPLPWNL